jgi:hypothetical protein
MTDPLSTLLSTYAPALLKGVFQQVGKASAIPLIHWWKRRGIVRRAAKKAAHAVRHEPGLRRVRPLLVRWTKAGSAGYALRRWTRGELTDPAEFVSSFVQNTGFATGGGAERTRETASKALLVFLQHIANETLLAEDASLTQTHLLDGRRAASDDATRAKIDALAKRVDPGLDLSTDWFRTQAVRAIRAADRRYTPDVHVPLPIEEAFLGLAHAPEFLGRLRSALDDIQGAAAAADPAVQAAPIDGFPTPAFEEQVRRLQSVIPDITPGFSPSAEQLSFGAQGLSMDAYNYARDCERRAKAGQDEKGARSGESHAYERAARACRKLYESAGQVASIASSAAMESAESGALLVTGAAGNGKTHLMCRIADERTEAGRPTILVLGQPFDRGEPWSHILSELGLDTTKDAFLDALNAVGKAAGQRALILIDALNESGARELWLSRLPQMVEDVRSHSHLALAISVRSDYLPLVVPSTLREGGELAEVEHRGFTGHEQEAADRYFGRYGVTPPATPILTPEYSNPLFLKLLCEGLERQGLDTIPEGLDGQSALVDFFLGALDAPEAIPTTLDIDPARRPARSAAERLATKMAEVTADRLPRSEAIAIVDGAADGPWSRSLYRQLVSEGLLREDPDYTVDPPAEVTAFAYERLGDHLVAQQLVGGISTVEELRRAFALGGALHALVADQAASNRAVGVLTALSVLIPERFSTELPLVVQDPTLEGVNDALVYGLLWRRGKTVTTETRELVREAVRRDWRLGPPVFRARLTLALRPDHPLNADDLHLALAGLAMAERDAWWARAVDRELSDDASLVWRLVEWAERGGEKTPPESVRLGGLTVAWFLASPHRPLRDRATKALVALYQHRLDALGGLLRAFDGLDAPYVTERLYAVAYGCAMRNRTSDPGAVGALAQAVYDLAFVDAPPVHVLTRDYARGVVECALSGGQVIDGDPSRARPPYTSDPLGSFPTDEEIAALLETHKRDGDEGWTGLDALRSSMLGMGDFSRYVLGSDHPSSFDWRSRTIGDPTPTLDDELDAFVAALSPEQADAYQAYRTVADAPPPYEWAGGFEVAENEDGSAAISIPPATLPATYEEERDRVASALVEVLSEDQAEAFRDRLRQHIESPERYPYPFDVAGLKNWILRRVFELGWTPERFGTFDVNHARHYWRRDQTAKPERVGKKYQWLAYHEAIARIADHHEYTNPYENEPKQVVPYAGPWRHFFRDIDPSCLLSHTTARVDEGDPFWPPEAEGLWGDGLRDAEWLRADSDLPDLARYLHVTDPEGRDLFALRFTMTWKDPSGSTREVWAHVTSALVEVDRLEEANEFGHRWRGTPNNTAGWIPWPHDPDHLVFLGEWHWSPAYHALRFGSEIVDPGETSIRGDGYTVPFAFEPTTETYKGSSQYDASLDERGLHIHLPSPGIARRLGLRWDGRAAWLDAGGARAVYDPTPYVGPAEDSRSVLLITREAVETLRRDHGLAVVWSIAGEKQRLEPGGGPLGHQRFFGAYRLYNGRPVGKLYTQFHSHI